jgi:hypothetical protein
MRIALLVLFLAMAAGAGYADAPGTANQQFGWAYILYGGSAVGSSNKITVTTTAKNSDAVCIGGGEDSVVEYAAVPGAQWFAIKVTVDASTTASSTAHVQVSRDGTNFYAVDTEVTFSLTNDQTIVCPISVPACKYIRVEFNPDSGNAEYSITSLELWRY